MSIILQFLIDFKEILGVIVSLLTTFGVIIGVVKKYNVILVNKISQIDVNQNARMNDIENKLLSQSEKTDIMYKFIADQPVAKELKEKISTSIEIAIKAKVINGRQIDNQELRSIFFAGEDALHDLIDYLFVIDFLNLTKQFNDQQFRAKAIYKLKTIKIQIQPDKLNVDCKFSTDLKHLIYHRLDVLISYLLKIKAYTYNGKSKEHLEQAFTECAENIIYDTIELYGDYKKLEVTNGR